jgi:hypothetical protein
MAPRRILPPPSGKRFFRHLTESRYIPNNRGIGCRWNILAPYDTFILAEAEADERVKLIYGASTNQMGADMRELLHGAKAHAVQTYLSAPVAIQSRPYYLHP